MAETPLHPPSAPPPQEPELFDRVVTILEEKGNRE